MNANKLYRKSVILVTTVAGTLHFFTGLGERLRAKNWVVFACSKKDSLLYERAASEGFLPVPLEIQRAISPICDAVAIAKFICFLNREKPAVVHAHTPKAGLVAMIAAWLVRVPVRVYTIHGLPVETARGVKGLLLWLADAVAIKCATEVYCVSPSVKSALNRLGLPRASSTKVLGHGTICGVDIESRFCHSAEKQRRRRQEGRESLGISPEAIVAGFVGRFVRDKGIRDLVAAWEQAHQCVPDLRMLMVGGIDEAGGAAGDELRKVTQRPEWVWTGWQSDVEKFYPVMDFLVLPSYREGFPTVVLEAAALGIPAIVTNSTGCIDAVVDGRTGIIVPVRDGKKLAEAIVHYSQHAELRNLHGNAARARVHQQFSQEFVQGLLADEYDRLWEQDQRSAGRLGKDYFDRRLAHEFSDAA